MSQGDVDLLIVLIVGAICVSLIIGVRHMEREDD